jgi:hypothetical protein
VNFKWYTWKSHRKAVVIFKKAESAEMALSALKQAPQFDGSNITFSMDKNK